MREIKDEVKAELRELGLKEWQINGVLIMRKLAIVDREAKLPENVYEPPLDITQEGWRDVITATQKQMLETGWVKEIK